jgi:uncharacterized protein (DUF952 family)
MSNPEFIYKVVTPALFAEALAAGQFTGAPVDIADGYIHFSTAAQLPKTLELYFAGQGDLVLFAVRSYDVGKDLVWEPSRGGALFPHVYGAFAMALVDWSAPISVAADGTCALPEAVR